MMEKLEADQSCPAFFMALVVLAVEGYSFTAITAKLLARSRLPYVFLFLSMNSSVKLRFLWVLLLLVCCFVVFSRPKAE